MRKKDVVDVTHNFIIPFLKRMKIADYGKIVKESLELKPDDFLVMLGELDTTDFNIMRLLMVKPCTAEELEKVLRTAEITIWKVHYPRLTRYGLIETKPSVGATVTDKGKVFWKAVEGLRQEAKP